MELQRYRDYKIRVWDQDLIPLETFLAVFKFKNWFFQFIIVLLKFDKVLFSLIRIFLRVEQTLKGFSASRPRNIDTPAYRYILNQGD